ncbi:MAG: hypothetical protein SF051_05345 [Elusimicrobiota bacterium]|nr:hypothetical protein [Elusimicrobiota bacterium]
MRRRWVLMDEWFFEIYARRGGRGGVKVVAVNPRGRDKMLGRAISEMIRCWFLAKEVRR